MILNSSKHLLLNHQTQHFDLVINATGYEERASSLIASNAISGEHYLSFLFDQHKVLDFDRNYQIMNGVRATFIEDPLQFFRGNFFIYANNLVQRQGRRLRIGLDVSSINRTMAATTLSAISAYRDRVESLDLYYVPAKFKAPKLTFSPIEQIGPVIPELSGFNSEPGLPLALVLGLGFEYGTAVGLINQLEPQLTICLRAIGHDVRFENAVKQANLQFDFSTYNVQISEYNSKHQICISAHREYYLRPCTKF